MKLRSTMVLAGALAALGPCASAATYYVSTTGNDSNPGTQATPFRHLSKGASAATQPGDTVIVMDGTYDNEGVREPNFVVTLYYSGTSGHPITFMAQNRGKAILDSGNTSSSSCNGAASYWNLYNASFIVIQGFVIQNACDSGFQSNNSAHDIVIRQNEVRHIGNWNITDQIGRDGIYLNSSESNFTFDSNVWHDIGRLGGNTLHFDHGIYSHAANLTITNNIFYNMKAGWSIQFADGANNYLIANNTFAFADTGDGESGQVMWWGRNTNMTFRNNIFYNPNNAAMTQYAATISGCVFDHNLVYPVSNVMNGSFPCSVTSNMTGSSPNPQFVNASAYNFYTQPGGAGVDAGVTLSAVPYDYAGTTRPQGSSTDVGAYEYIGSGSSAPVISGMFTSGISTNSAVVNWSTDQPSTSYVQYGLSSYTNTTATDPTLVTIHSVALSGLSASSLYHFRSASTNSSGQTTFSADSTFTTAPGGYAQAATPTFSPPAGSYGSTQSVTITTTTSGASIRYTTDGSVPTSSVGTLYNSNTPVSVSSNLTLKAIAYMVGTADSSVASAGYVITGGGGSNSATFVKADTATQGSWKGVYGAQGHNVFDDTVSYPSYVTVTPAGQSDYVWASSTSDVRGLQKGLSSTDRIAATWYTNGSFTIDLNFKDGAQHQLAVYCLDWDSGGARAQTLSILDGTTNAVLNSQSVVSFQNGKYVVWNLTGHVILKVTDAGGVNAVISGLFFDAPNVGGSNSATFVKADTATQGSWKGVYGAQGHNVFDDTVSYPSYVSVTPSGQSDYVWASSTSDVRGLQKGLSSTDRIAATWYTNGSFTIDLNFKDGAQHQLAVYCLDWDSGGARAQTLSILDGTTNAVLNSQSVVSFQNGKYVVWNLTGHVILKVTNAGGVNAVISGLFFN